MIAFDGKPRMHNEDDQIDNATMMLTIGDAPIEKLITLFERCYDNLKRIGTLLKDGIVHILAKDDIDEENLDMEKKLLEHNVHICVDNNNCAFNNNVDCDNHVNDDSDCADDDSTNDSDCTNDDSTNDDSDCADNGNMCTNYIKTLSSTAALLSAIANQNLSAVDKLLANGANVHANDDAPLLLAVSDQNLKLVEKLLEYGANIHCNDDAILKNLKYKFDKCFVDQILSCCASSLCEGDPNYLPTFAIRCITNAREEAVLLRTQINNFLSNVQKCNFASITGNILRQCFYELLNEQRTDLDYDSFYDGRRRAGDTFPKLKKMIGYELANKILYYDTNIDTMTYPWHFNEELADVILRYCTANDYSYFPNWYIKEKIVFLKKAERAIS